MAISTALEQKDKPDGRYDDSSSLTESYGSDNDDLSSFDSLYSEKGLAKPILIPLDDAAVSRFDQYVTGYVECTRSSQRESLVRYEVLCLINESWQKVLIHQEFKKRALDEAALGKAGCALLTEDVYEDGVQYSPYKLRSDDTEWMTPCQSPRKNVVLRDAAGSVLYSAVIPSAEIFGSIRTRLDCEGSDLDITLPNSVDCPAVDVWLHHKAQKQKLSAFIKILRQQNLQKYRFEIYPILKAKVPIVKIKEKRTGLDMDIAIESSQRSVSALIGYYCACDVRARPFIIAIKHWSKRRGLCDAMNHFPNSFGFVLLAIKLLQMVNVLPVCRINGDQRVEVVAELDASVPNTDSFLELMVRFFEMYRRFNFKMLQISTSRVGLGSKTRHEAYASLKEKHQTTMVVEDPSSSCSNVTRNVRPFRLLILQKECFRAFKATKHADWELLTAAYSSDDDDGAILDFYAPSNSEEERFSKHYFEGSGSGELKNEMEPQPESLNDFGISEHVVPPLLAADDAKAAVEEEYEVPAFGAMELADEIVIDMTSIPSSVEDADAVILESILNADGLLLDSDILVFWTLAPFKNELIASVENVEHFDVERIDHLLGEYGLTMAEFVRISKLYAVAFSLEFCAFYRGTKRPQNFRKYTVFDLLNVVDAEALNKESEGTLGVLFRSLCLEQFAKRNNSHHFEVFWKALHLKTWPRGAPAVPESLENAMVTALGNTRCDSLLLHYSYFISFVSLFAFWKALFWDIDQIRDCFHDRRATDHSMRIADAEWLALKIFDSMTVLGLCDHSRWSTHELLTEALGQNEGANGCGDGHKEGGGGR